MLDSWRPGNRENADLLDNFWRQMIGIYGQLWVKSYGDVPLGSAAQMWLATLRGLSETQVTEGKRHCLQSGDRYPPNPGQFRTIAIANARPEHRVLPPAARIERQSARKEVVDEHLSKLRAMLGSRGDGAE